MGPSTYQITDSQSNTYYINFCQRVSDTWGEGACSKSSPSAACQTSAGSTFPAGTVASQTMVPYVASGSTLSGSGYFGISYTGGQSCPSFGTNRQTIIYMNCDEDAGDGSVI